MRNADQLREDERFIELYRPISRMMEEYFQSLQRTFVKRYQNDLEELGRRVCIVDEIQSDLERMSGKIFPARSRKTQRPKLKGALGSDVYEGTARD